ncbi:hypothetical protein C8R45DRAFT_1213545 [Mycena sanguinolenta]|nr:hypothetical protein C8R45DRAFT_1213545 [Mycena sanguinolenta]
MPRIKAVLFDFMGTCLDWHSSIAAALPDALSADQRSKFALEWRQTYFDYNAARLAAGQPPEDIDISPPSPPCSTTPPAWHNQPAWPDVAPALAALRAKGYELFVHANGTTRLQLDLVRSSKLAGLFDCRICDHPPNSGCQNDCFGGIAFNEAPCSMTEWTFDSANIGGNTDYDISNIQGFSVAYRPGDISGTCGGTGPVDQAARVSSSSGYTVVSLCTVLEP